MAQAFRFAIDRMADHFRGKPVDAVAATDARLCFRRALGDRVGRRLLAGSQAGGDSFHHRPFEYRLHEYHADVLEGYKALINPEQRILLVDDLLATGTSTEACCRLIEQAGGHVAGCALDRLRTSTVGPDSPNTTS